MSEIRPITPVLIALDTNTHREAQELISQTMHLPNDLVGYKIPHGLTVRHFNTLVPQLREAGKYVVTDTRFNDYTNKIDEEISTFLECDDRENKAELCACLPHAFTMLALREGTDEDRYRMVAEIIPAAHQKGLRIFGIMPPILIIDNDTDQLAGHAEGKYRDARALGLDAIDIPQPVLDGFSNGTHMSGIGIIASQFAHPNRSSQETIQLVRNTLAKPEIVSVYLGRPLQNWQAEGNHPADFIEACLE